MRLTALPVTMGIAAISLATFVLNQGFEHHRVKAEETKWQQEIADAHLTGQPPGAVIAFLDSHKMSHTGYLKTPYDSGEPRSPGHRVLLDRHIFTQFGTVTGLWNMEGGESRYVATSFGFTAKGIMGGWTMTTSPNKMHDGRLRSEF